MYVCISGITMVFGNFIQNCLLTFNVENASDILTQF